MVKLSDLVGLTIQMAKNYKNAHKLNLRINCFEYI